MFMRQYVVASNLEEEAQKKAFLHNHFFGKKFSFFAFPPLLLLSFTAARWCWLLCTVVERMGMSERETWKIFALTFLPPSSSEWKRKGKLRNDYFIKALKKVRFYHPRVCFIALKLYAKQPLFVSRFRGRREMILRPSMILYPLHPPTTIRLTF